MVRLPSKADNYPLVTTCAHLLAADVVSVASTGGLRCSSFPSSSSDVVRAKSDLCNQLAVGVYEPYLAFNA